MRMTPANVMGKNKANPHKSVRLVGNFMSSNVRANRPVEGPVLSEGLGINRLWHKQSTFDRQHVASGE
jgi:hypothetical protein